MDKKELRRYIRTLKEEHSAEEKEVLSQDICSAIMTHPKIKEASTILAYWSLPDEVNTHNLVEELWRQGKRVLLPKVISDTEMTIHEFLGLDSMAEGAYGIMEPTTPAIDFHNEASLAEVGGTTVAALIPGMAFSYDGYRLGRGKGYYDRFLSHTYIYKIGVCYPFQLFDTIPHDQYDIRMDEMVKD